MADAPRMPYMGDDLDVRAIVVGGLAIGGATAIALAAAYAMVHVGVAEGPSPRIAAQLHARPPAVAGKVLLQSDPAVDLGALLREKRTLLTTYAWMDRDRGIARIPIARAMALLAKRGRAP